MSMTFMNRLKQLFCVHEYRAKDIDYLLDFDNETVEGELRCCKCGKVTKLSGSFKDYGIEE